MVCLAGFPDFTGTTIATAALLTIPAHLHSSVQSRQWAVNGSLPTCRGLQLRAGTSLFGVPSLASRPAANVAMLTGVRPVRALGSATMTPATTGKAAPRPRPAAWKPSATACSR